MVSLEELIRHAPVEVFQRVTDMQEYCNLCKAPVGHSIHTEPYLEANNGGSLTLVDVRVEYLSTMATRNDLLRQMGQLGFTVNEVDIRLSRLEYILDRHILGDLDKLHRLQIESGFLGNAVAELKRLVREAREQARAQSLTVAKRPSGIIVPGR